MDPVTAFTNLATKMLDIIMVVIQSQPPDVQQQMWRWYVQDLAWWRKFLKIDVDDE
jgi:hypothetical protein